MIPDISPHNDAQYPLARLLLDFFTLAGENFDHIPIVDLLHRHNLFDWHLLQSSPHNFVGDPLGVLLTMVDLLMEVDEAARAIDGCLVAGTEEFLNPYLQTEPTALSDAGYTRIACSLWVVQIYYRARVQIALHPHEISSSFPEALLRKMKPWQVEQGRCIDHFLRSYYYE